MARKQILQTTLFFLMAYAFMPWVCNLVVQHFDEQVFDQAAPNPIQNNTAIMNQ